MKAKAPHFVLFSESTAASPPHGSTDAARVPDESARYWHFVLRTEEGSVALDVRDEEADASNERLVLLAVVRGLEALPEPSRVTLVTTSGWIRRGLRFGLDNWRDHQWQWERFGKMAPIKNADLWRRVDRALRFHEVDCRTIRFDRPSDDLSHPVPRSLFARRRGVATPSLESARQCGHRRRASFVEEIRHFLRSRGRQTSGDAGKKPNLWRDWPQEILDGTAVRAATSQAGPAPLGRAFPAEHSAPPVRLVRAVSDQPDSGDCRPLICR